MSYTPRRAGKQLLLEYVDNGRSKYYRRAGKNTLISLVNGGKDVVVTLHGTNIVSYVGDSIVLNSGNYRTVTIKKYMNKYSPVGIFQKDWKWYVCTGGQVYDFYDGMMFLQNADGTWYCVSPK
jgi:hypothetical protein